MKQFVYELINLMGTIEYVGQTCNPKERMYKHTRVKPNDNFTGYGKFYGRSDIVMHIVKSFDNKKDALVYESKLQKEYGFTIDKERNKGRTHTNETKLKISKARKGKGIGKRSPFTDEHKLKLSEVRKLYWLNKKNKP